jgi:hypothetical protein
VALIVVAADALAALLDATHDEHLAACGRFRRLAWCGDRIAVPATEYTALLVEPLAVGAAYAGVVDALVSRLDARVVPIDTPLARRAAQLCAAHRELPVAGAYVIATAVTAGADAVITATRSWPRARALGVPFRIERLGAPLARIA